ncbi:shikimate kinase 3, chloroplastic [Dioscorea cayenensis subsp. rotundata]|uniref:shikimate kinase n=1 Tax=Dioscorea cayennensis subsp. rotundata TaxID=55577 RepID=A0AB40BBU5_DIOCR|nr:shikimate kinase 3, chloroplastic [Dioscorea cayenensis subsp. rotundata]
MMEALAALSLQPCSWIACERPGKAHGGFLKFSKHVGDERKFQKLSLRGASEWDNNAVPRISSCYRKRGVSAVGSENVHAFVDEALVIKRKSEDVAPYLNGRCIYLVGMMGSGKTTVGKILSEVLGYSFFDSDKLVEQSVGMSSVAQIFQERSEAFFRDSESEVLRDLSTMHRLVVATGGGAVIRPINWKYMKHGITVWLDVPLEALARRIAAVGTASRPLLHQESGDPFTKAFTRLTTLAEQRGDAYANADARVCLQHIASKQGHNDVGSLTPTAIAIEALLQVENFVTPKGARASGRRNSYRQA